MLNLSPYMRVNKIEATYKVSHVNVKIKRGSIFTFAHDLSYLDLLYLQAYTCKKYVAGEIYLQDRFTRSKSASMKTGVGRGRGG